MKRNKLQPGLFDAEECPLFYASAEPVETPAPATWIEMRAAVIAKWRNCTMGQARVIAENEFQEFQNET